jgi:hypothetical protein
MVTSETERISTPFVTSLLNSYTIINGCYMDEYSCVDKESCRVVGYNPSSKEMADDYLPCCIV